MIKLESSSYGGEVFRPQPEIWVDDRANFIAVVTAWGKKSIATKAIEFLKEFLIGTGSENLDEEVTSAFEVLEELSPVGNQLRRAVLTLNENLFCEENQHEYKAGLELFLATVWGEELTWVQYGQPSLYLVRDKKPLVSLGSESDLSLEHSLSYTLPPLPKHLLGMSFFTAVQVKTIRLQKRDRLLLLSRSADPIPFEYKEEKEKTMSSLREFLSKDDERMPFWLGLFEIQK